MIRRFLKAVNVNSLTDAQKKEIRKILSDRHQQSAADVKAIDSMLAKKPKPKRTTKR